MKKAKVSKGIVRMVWPWVKDGIVRKLPAQYRGLNGKPVPDCIVDVPDEVQPNWVWDGEKYAPRVKKPVKIGHSDLLDVISERLGISSSDLLAEAMKRKKARHAAAKED